MHFDNFTLPHTIGGKIAVIRHLFGLTQVQFTQYILLTRANLARLENSRDEELKQETLLKLYYSVSKIHERTKEKTVKDVTKVLIDDISTAIERTNSKKTC